MELLYFLIRKSFNALLKIGIITQVEFDEKKKQMLGISH